MIRFPWDETDFLAFPADGNGEPGVSHEPACFLLCLSEQGKIDTGKSLPGHEAQKIGLILVCVRRPAEHGGILRSWRRTGAQSRVMACNKTVRAKAESLFEEGAEFHGAVADSAGVGREPPAVGGSEIGDDAGLEFSAQIQNPERHAQYTAVFSQSADGLCVFLFRSAEEGVYGNDIASTFSAQYEGAQTVHAAGYGNSKAPPGDCPGDALIIG